MCNKNSPPDMKTRSKIKKEREAIKPARKTRTKTRKPKFLSLRLKLSSDNSQNSTQMTHNCKTNHHDQHHQLNLFPLHPENLVEDHKVDIHDENVAFLFNSEGGGGATTLNGLLSGVSSSEEDSLSPPPYAYGGQDSEEGRLADVAGNNCDQSASSKLVRTAMRNRDRDLSGEKWVFYSEVLVEKKEPEEVTSCATDVVWCAKRLTTPEGSLSLKLDYQGILKAWSGKGPLYIEGESPPQTVPDLHDDFLPHDTTADDLVDSWGSAANLWRVPEMGNGYFGSIKVKEEVEGKDGWKMRHREASVLRYKEKRQNRLFSKRIRYEVRKLNAEKRPRMKGRFVKRS